jgi:hypothetical protein
MSMNGPISLPLSLPLSWWRRLQQVAQACSTSPSEFVREVLEAEIVRRELLMDSGEEAAVSWLGEINAPSTSQVQ